MRTAKQTAAGLDMLFGSPLDIVSWSLRGMLRAAPGKELLCADFANIEGRGLPWLSGEDWKLDAFRAFDAGEGPDLYLVAAAAAYRIPVETLDAESPERKPGKVLELSAGFGGGLGAFRQMEKNLGLKLGLSDDEVNSAKDGWRGKHPKIVQYWADLEEAALWAVLHPGLKASAGAKGRRVTFLVNGSFLFCKLPSGRVLTYPYPKILPVKTPWGAVKDAVTYMTVVSQDMKAKAKIIPDAAAHGEWQRVSTYGGKLSENVTQAICRDILAHVMFECEAAGFPIVLHVHDEVVAEVPAGTGDLKAFEAICSRVPPWAAGLPVVAKGWVGQRYRKG